jgi:hypothetical protein
MRTWQVAPTSERIVEDIHEFFESVDEIVETEGVFMEKNLHRGRRAELLCKVVPSAKEETPKTAKKRKRVRSKAATMEEVALHPDAQWCMDKELELAMEDGFFTGDGSRMSALEPLLEEEGVAQVGGEELVSTSNLPVDWVALHSLNHFQKRADQVRAAKLARKLEKLKEKELLREKKKKITEAARAAKNAEKARDKAANTGTTTKKRPAKKKTKKKQTVAEFDAGLDELPPLDHIIEYYWPSGASEGWFEGKYKGATTNLDGEVESLLEDGNGIIDMCGIELQELHWRLLYPCTTCNKNTREERICMACKECRDDAGSESDSDGDSDY